MRRLAAGLGLGMGLAWLFRRLRPSAQAVARRDDPAEELRRKLAESRTPETAPEPEPEPPLDERRRTVHERGRAAIDEMRGTGQAPATDQG